MKNLSFFYFFLIHIYLYSQATPLFFTENKGQVCDQNYKNRGDILYSGSTGGLAFHFRTSGVSYQLSKANSWQEREDLKSGRKVKFPSGFSVYRIDVNWPGSNESFTMQQDDSGQDYCNYYLASCPQGVHNVRSYSGITYKNIYKNIDLHYYSKEGSLKYDYIVQPTADYRQIRLQIDGAETITKMADGSILLKTPLGDLKEDAPLVYQKGKQLKAKWVVEKNIISFAIENYDPTILLIIDPAVRIWGTYCGNSEDEFSTCTTLDASGNIYMGGYCGSLFATYMATSGAHQTTCQGGEDGFLAKFDASGSRIWSTYYGDTSDDYIYSCATDAIGNIFATGETYLPTGTSLVSAGSFQSNFGGFIDAFLVKFDSNGVRQWATYYGGAGIERATGCASDNQGNIYMLGISAQTTISVLSTPGSHQPLMGSSNDAFLVKFNTAGSRIWATYYGGPEAEYSGSCATDNMGNVYFCGATETSTGLSIATANSHQPLYAGGDNEGFLVKFDSSGNRIWGTYYGGTGKEKVLHCTTDPSGNIFITGDTESLSGISSSGSHQPVSGGGPDAFLAKFDSNGSRLWSTYYGGSWEEKGVACTSDPAGNIYIAGSTKSQNVNAISTINSQQTFNPAFWCSFLAKFDTYGNRQFGTFFGGDDTYGAACSANWSGVYFSGNTLPSATNPDLIITQGTFQSLGTASNDPFLAKFTDSYPTVLTEQKKDPFSFYVFPNPTHGDLYLKVPGLKSDCFLEILSTTGQVLLKHAVKTVESRLDLKDFPKGIYLLRLYSDSICKTIKIINE